MSNLTLITTLYTLEPVITCVTRLSPSKLIILTEEGTVEKKLQAEQMLEATFGKVIEIEKKNHISLRNRARGPRRGKPDRR